MPALTEEQKAELLKLSPEELVKKLANQNEANDRIAAKAEAAEKARIALETKAKEEAEAARLKDASEAEKERAARTKAEQTLVEERNARKAERVASAVRLAAIRSGAADPDDVLAILGVSGIEVDDAGNPKDVDAAVKGLLEKKPHLKGNGSSGWVEGKHADTGTGSRGGGSGAKTITRSAFDALTDAERHKFIKDGGKTKD